MKEPTRDRPDGDQRLGQSARTHSSCSSTLLRQLFQDKALPRYHQINSFEKRKIRLAIRIAVFKLFGRYWCSTVVDKPSSE